MKQLEVIEQRVVEFYDDQLTAIRAKDGQIYVSIRQMCDALGVDRRGQIRRIQNHDVLAEGYKRGGLTSPPSSSNRGGGIQQTAVLRVDLIPLWLSGISPSRVSEEVRSKLKLFQKNAARILWEAFQSGELSADETFNQLLQQGGDAVEAYKMLQGMLQLAKNQILLQAQVKDNTLRLDAIEAELGNTDRFITVPQAAQLSDAVRSVGLVFSQMSGRNEYGGVYGELHRRFSINSYKRLPAAKFEEAMGWLRQWHEELADGDDAPF